MIDWYTNKGQSSSIVNEHNVVLLRSIALRDSIGSVHKMIFFFITSQRPNRTILCYKTFFYWTVAQQDRAGDSVILRTENIG